MVRAAGRGRKPRWRPATIQWNKPLRRPPMELPLEMITRGEWAAAPRLELDSDIRLQLPVMHIRYSYTDTQECANPEECIPFLQNLQRDWQQKGYPDLMYNYLIGSDGMLYEGRGLDWKCSIFDDPWVNTQGESLSIAYIGSFPDVKAPIPFRATSKILEKWMLKYGFLHEMYEITPSICRPENFYNKAPMAKTVEGDDSTPEPLSPEKLALLKGGDLPSFDELNVDPAEGEDIFAKEDEELIIEEEKVEVEVEE